MQSTESASTQAARDYIRNTLLQRERPGPCHLKGEVLAEACRLLDVRANLAGEKRVAVAAAIMEAWSAPERRGARVGETRKQRRLRIRANQRRNTKRATRRRRY
jgi:hypothetical protein